MKIKPGFRITAFLTLIVAFFAIKVFTPVGEQLTVENLRLLIEPMGTWGVVIFVAAFIVGTIFQVPGVLFYSASFLIFGSLLGGLIAYIGSVLAVVGSFYFARHMGGSMLDRISNKRIRKLMFQLEQQPVLIVSILRTFMWVSPPLNYALAFSTISSRTYIIGSTIGLLVPVICMGLGTTFLF
jgi:uncharacterized membrane protein YdjX (TVP38/TMEM64 family)